MKKFLLHIFSYLGGRQVEQIVSKLNGTLYIYHINGRYLLNSIHGNYSYGPLHKGFKKAFDRLDVRKRTVQNALILGFGAGSIVSILQEEYGLNCKITAIENDPVILELGQKYFNTQRFRDLDIHLTDAFDFVLNNDETYDLIAFDVYIDDRIPGKFESSEFLNALKGMLSKNGLLVFNKDTHSAEMRKQLAVTESLFRDIFPEYRKDEISRGSYFFSYKNSEF
jgi:spermidine synthase